MKSIPFYLGVLLIIPEAAQIDRQTKFPNGIGVAAVMTADSAILHEAIKENIQHQAFLVWVDAQGRKATRQATQAIEAIVNNIRYVSIENTWYKIIREVSKTSLLRKAIAKLSVHTHNNTNNDQQKVVVTVFAETTYLATDAANPGKVCPEMAMIVDRFQSLHLP